MKNALKEVPPSKNHIQANVDRMRKIQKQARQRDKQKVCFEIRAGLQASQQDYKLSLKLHVLNNGEQLSF